MKTLLAAVIVVGLLAVTPGGSVKAQEPPQRSVFVVVVMEHAVQGPHLPAVGDDVRVLGFGYLREAPIPYEWSATGTVSRTGELGDGTQVFEVTMTREAGPGHSGSPVLNLSDQVVGLWNWGSHSDSKKGAAISSPALDPACP